MLLRCLGACAPVTNREVGRSRLASPGYGRLQPENLAANGKLADRVAELARARGLSAAQLSLAWVHAQGDDVCPIPGTTSLAHLEDNVQAACRAPLTEAERELVAATVPAAAVQGTRFAGGDPNKGTYRENL